MNQQQNVFICNGSTVPEKKNCSSTHRCSVVVCCLALGGALESAPIKVVISGVLVQTI